MVFCFIIFLTDALMIFIRETRSNICITRWVFWLHIRSLVFHFTLNIIKIYKDEWNHEAIKFISSSQQSMHTYYDYVLEHICGNGIKFCWILCDFIWHYDTYIKCYVGWVSDGWRKTNCMFVLFSMKCKRMRFDFLLGCICALTRCYKNDVWSSVFVTYYKTFFYFWI